MSIRNFLLGSSVIIMVGGCAGGDNPGREYAPNMYHSVAYEPLTQIKDENAGRWVNSLDNDRGEYFNSNKYNPFWMNMRTPPANTVKRNIQGWLPYRVKRVAKDSVPMVTVGLKNPFDSTAAVLADGKMLYETYCKHCHGATGAGDGKVGEKVGAANLKGRAYLGITEGHIFHVITNGAGLMASHGSQVSPEDRWKIAKYVKALQAAK
jgi:mono/diheme cytochrome c family protein